MLADGFGGAGQGGNGLLGTQGGTRQLQELAEIVETKADTSALQNLVTMDQFLVGLAQSNRTNAAALEAANRAVTELQQTVRALIQKLYGVPELL